MYRIDPLTLERFDTIAKMIFLLLIMAGIIIAISIPTVQKYQRERRLDKSYMNWKRKRYLVSKIELDGIAMCSNEAQGRILAELGALAELKAHRDLTKDEYAREADLVEMYDGMYVAKMPEM